MKIRHSDISDDEDAEVTFATDDPLSFCRLIGTRESEVTTDPLKEMPIDPYDARPIVGRAWSTRQRGRAISLSLAEELVLINFRICSNLALDDCHFSFAKVIPGLSRSGLHRCFERNGVSRLAGVLPPECGIGASPGHIRLSMFQIDNGGWTSHVFTLMDVYSKLTFSETLPDINEQSLKGLVDDFCSYFPFPINTLEIVLACAAKNDRVINSRSMRQYIVSTIQQYTKGISVRLADIEFNSSEYGDQDMGISIHHSVDNRYGKPLDSVRPTIWKFDEMYNFGSRLMAHGGMSPVRFLGINPRARAY